MSDINVVDVICDDLSVSVMEDIMGIEPVKNLFNLVDNVNNDINENIKMIVENYVDIRSHKPPIEISKKFQDLSEKNKICIDSCSEEYTNLNEEHFKIKIKDILDDMKNLGTGNIINCLKAFLEKFMEVGYQKLTCESRQKEFKFGLISKSGNNYKFLIFSFLYDTVEVNHNINLIVSLNKSNQSIHYSHFYSTFTISKRQICKYLEKLYNDYYYHKKLSLSIDSKIFELADILFYDYYNRKIIPNDISQYLTM